MPRVLYDLAVADFPELVPDFFPGMVVEPACGRALDASVPISFSGRSEATCLWCGRGFRRRATGGSSQKFCSAGHRDAFWTAARRWTMRAIETGLLSVDCLKAAQGSMHAAKGAFRWQGSSRPHGAPTRTDNRTGP